jgi:hypothetical protein
MFGQFMFVPNGSNIHLSFGICTTGSYTSVSCYADVERMKNPQELVDNFIYQNKKNIKQIMTKL